MAKERDPPMVVTSERGITLIEESFLANQSIKEMIMAKKQGRSKEDIEETEELEEEEEEVEDDEEEDEEEEDEEVEASDEEEDEEEDEDDEEEDDDDDGDEDDDDADDDDSDEEEDEEEEDEKPKKKKVKKGAKPPAKGTISYTVFTFLTDMSIKKPTFDAIAARVKKRHPDSKFNESHLNWYRNHFAKNVGATINMPLETPEARSERLKGQLKKARESLKEKNPVMFARTLPEKERKKFIKDLDPKTRKLVEKGLAERSKKAVDDDEDEEKAPVVVKKKKIKK